MMSYIKDENVFGTWAAYILLIDFKKRGLPHAHGIFFLD